MRFDVPAMMSSTLPGSTRTAAEGVAEVAVGRLNCSATNPVNMTPKRAIAMRAYFLKSDPGRRPRSLLVRGPRPGLPKICERQLDERFPIVLVLFERERDVDRTLVLSEIVVLLSGAPGDRAEDASVLLQRHLQVAFLQRARTVDDFHTARRKDRPRIACAERRQRCHASRDVAGDRAEREIAVDAQTRHQIIGAKRFVRNRIHREPQLLDPRGVE